MKRFAVGAALAALVASPAFAQKMPGAYMAYGPVTPFGAPGDFMNPARAAAVNQCSREESKYKQTTWAFEQSPSTAPAWDSTARWNDGT
jgi:hypothetical protein